MALRVTLKDGPLAGRSREFDSGRAEIRFGRDPEFADVVFPPDKGGVSRRHCVLQSVAGGYRLLLCGTNPVFVGGQPAPNGTVLAGSFEMQLGEGGPCVGVQVAAPEQPQGAPPAGNRLRGPVGGAAAGGGGVPRRPEGTETRIQRLGRQLRHSQLIAAGAVVLVLVVGLGAFLLTRSLAERATSDKEEMKAKLDEAGREQKRIRDAMQASMDKVQGDVQKRMEAELERREKERRERDEASGKAAAAAAQGNTSLQRAIEKTTPSVYMVGTLGVSGGLVQAGTAWVVGDGVLATNAHVAQLFSGGRGGTKFIARSNASPPQDFEVESVTVHPGYEAFARLLNLHTPIDLSGDPLQLIPACDVALLHVAKGARLGQPIPLASAETLARLARGAPVAFIGYPTERMAGGGTDSAHPEPTVQVGSLTSISDNFHGQGALEDRLLVQFNMPAAGGASGSPVIDSDGKAVAVLSAGNVVHIEGARIPIAGVNFGQRVDLVGELLDGSAERKTAARAARWEAALLDQVKSKADALRDLILQQVSMTIEENEQVRLGGTPRRIHEQRGELRAPGSDEGTEFRVPLPEAGHYVVICIAERYVDLAFGFRGVNEPDYRPAKREDLQSMVCMTPLRSDGPVTVSILAFARTQFQGPVPFSLHVYHLQP